MNIKYILIIYFSLSLFFSIACEDNTSTGENIIPSEEITLETCDENINDNAPLFFKKYFKCVDIELNNDNVIISTDGVPPFRS